MYLTNELACGLEGAASAASSPASSRNESLNCNFTSTTFTPDLASVVDCLLVAQNRSSRRSESKRNEDENNENTSAAEIHNTVVI